MLDNPQKYIKEYLVPNLAQLEKKRKSYVQNLIILKLITLLIAWGYLITNDSMYAYFQDEPIMFLASIALSIIYLCWSLLIQLIGKTHPKVLYSSKGQGLIIGIILSFICLFVFNPTIVIAFAVSFGLYYAIGYYFFLNPFNKAFKEEFVSNAFLSIDPNLEYDPKDYVDEKDYNESLLFANRDYHHYKGEDYLCGNYNETPFELSEIKVEKDEFYYSEGKRKRRKITVYSGLFMKMELKNNLKSALVLRPNISEGYNFGGSQLLKDIFGIDLNSNEYAGLHKYKGVHKRRLPFLDIFCYEEDIVEKLITKEFATNFKRLRDNGIYATISFIDNYMYVAFPPKSRRSNGDAESHGDYLEANILCSLKDEVFLYQSIEPYLECLKLIDVFKVKGSPLTELDENQLN